MNLIPLSNYGNIWSLINFSEVNWFGLAFYNILILFISSCFINYWKVSIKTKIKNYNNLYFILKILIFLQITIGLVFILHSLVYPPIKFFSLSDVSNIHFNLNPNFKIAESYIFTMDPEVFNKIFSIKAVIINKKLILLPVGYNELAYLQNYFFNINKNIFIDISLLLLQSISRLARKY